MIKSLFIAVLVLGVLVAIAAVYAPTLMSNSIELSVLNDKTDSFLAEPDTSEIIALLNIPDHRWDAIHVQVQAVTNVDYNTVTRVTLPARTMLLSNPHTRDAEIGAFTNKVNDAIAMTITQDAGHDHSSIHNVVMSEINRVALTNANVKMVVLYVDLFENTPAFSIYNQNNRILLKEHPEKVQAILENIIRPGNLHGVVIHIIYQPKNEEDNDMFTRISSIYRKMLTDAGAQVYIGANMVSLNN